ncbi:MAG: cytochrome b/b6 domain-containing protein [Steroidobacteraceae bacterium]
MNDAPILRHRGADRLFHWVMAASVLVLLATGLLPQLGVQFDWVALHWSAGLLLVVAIAFHVVRVIARRSVAAMHMSSVDVAQLRALAGGPAVLPGKYSLAQKAMHHAVALPGLAAAATGLLMLAKVDTPFWQRNPYWLEAGTWGIVYVVHGLAALCLLSLVMLHLYFALRPEKRCYLQAMHGGWMSRADWRARHDAALWPGEATDPGKQGAHR